MVPVLVFIMLMFNIVGLGGTLLLMGLGLAQILSMLFTRNKVGLAELMAGTVPVELNSQRIFATTEDLIPDLLDFDPAQMDPEARPGEYYLDSLCVLPTHRGHGIGRMLLQRAIADGQAQGFTPTLAVHPENLKAQALYARQGFRPAGRYFIFGEDYLRMQV